MFIEPFIKEREKLMKDKVYNPRSVVDDEEGQMYDEDDNWII